MIEFPQGFLWGAATSAYQVEGNNVNSDWWAWEKETGLVQASGLACRHYELYRQDFDLAANLHHNTHRLSVEWSRIQPQEGRFLDHEIKHYQEVISYLKERNLEPIVTLHHFTNPLWFARIGAWERRESVDYFLRYVARITEALCDKVKYWVTINEPMVYVYHAYILGVWPPQYKSFSKARIVEKNLVAAHIKAYKLIHQIYQKRNLPPPMVSIAHNMQAFVACRPTLRNKIALYLRHNLYNMKFVEILAKCGTLDFIGVNYYNRGLIDVKGWVFSNLLFDVCQDNHLPLKKNSLGWDIYPEGLYRMLICLKKYNLPVMITENGICTPDDNLRWEYIRTHLENISRAMGQGVEVTGYTYWSLIDNFEWHQGFSPRFGLIEVDYATYKRTVRESAKNFAEVCRTGKVE